jgi:hypothetical protein
MSHLSSKEYLFKSDIEEYLDDPPGRGQCHLDSKKLKNDVSFKP